MFRQTCYTLLSTDKMMELANMMLQQAEDNRRVGAGEFQAGPMPGAAVTADWSVAAGIIDRACHHLDESLPNGQRDRTSAALGALLLGAEMLYGACADRGVMPVRLTISLPQE